MLAGFVSHDFLSLNYSSPSSPRIHIPHQPRANPPLTFLPFYRFQFFAVHFLGRSPHRFDYTFSSNNPLGGFGVLLHISACFVSVKALFVFALIERVLVSLRCISSTARGLGNVVCCHADSSYAHISDDSFDIVPHDHFFLLSTGSECLSSENRHCISPASVCRRNISKFAVFIQATQSTI